MIAGHIDVADEQVTIALARDRDSAITALFMAHHARLVHKEHAFGNQRQQRFVGAGCRGEKLPARKDADAAGRSGFGGHLVILDVARDFTVEFDALSAEDFQQIYAVNVIGAYQMTRAFAPEGVTLHPSVQLGGDYASGDSGGARFRAAPSRAAKVFMIAKTYYCAGS